MKAQNNIHPNEETELKIAPVAKNAKKSSTWHNVLVGGVPGILIGAGITAAYEVFGESVAVHVPSDPEPGRELVSVEVHEAHSVSDDMSFSEAFAAARSEVGPGGAFVWHGQVYGTHRGDDPEWLEMSPEERAEHCQSILSHVHAGAYTPVPNEPPIEIVDEEPGEEFIEEVKEEYGEEARDESNNVSGEEIKDEPIENLDGEHSDNLMGQGTNDSGENGSEIDESEVDVHIVGVGQEQTEEDIETNAVFADTDGDGEVDTVLIDSNGEESIDESIETIASDVTMDDTVEHAEIDNVETPADQLFDNIPEYTDDADVSSVL